MSNKLSVYPGVKISVQYDAKRCIHAAECVRGLPGVFDSNRKPWINPNEADADAVAEAVMRCPTGALHFLHHDDGPAETAPAINSISVHPDGPLLVRGRLEILGADGGVVLEDTRVALCRCGASRNKPFCDGSHTQAGFQEAGLLGANVVKTVAADAQDTVLRITPSANGPLALQGPAEIASTGGQTAYSGNRMYLCRCGASDNKPFCDGAHARTDFNSSA